MAGLLPGLSHSKYLNWLWLFSQHWPVAVATWAEHWNNRAWLLQVACPQGLHSLQCSLHLYCFALKHLSSLWPSARPLGRLSGGHLPTETASPLLITAQGPTAQARWGARMRNGIAHLCPPIPSNLFLFSWLDWKVQISFWRAGWVCRPSQFLCSPQEQCWCWGASAAIPHSACKRWAGPLGNTHVL